jgi:flagella basal body P-ring formation protein FlgA
MSQTTDQARGRSAASGSARKPRSARTPRGSSTRTSVPAPPRRRRPALTALAVLLIVGGAALAGLLAVRMDSREPVLVVSQQVSTGQQITADMLESRNVSGDELGAIPADQKSKVLRYYARQTLYKGQLLQADLLRTSPPLAQDQAQVGVPLTSGKFPPGLRSGDAVRLVRIGDAQNPSLPLSTGLVIEVSKAKSSSFGSDARASVATIVVPQSVVDAVVGATGTDDLGIALIGRGIGIGEAEITDLSGGKG